MRFVDASVFLYAYLKPKRPIPTGVAEMKRRAREIVARISAGERASTSLIHLSEVANILEAVMSLNESREIISDLVSSETIEVLEITKRDFLGAVDIAEESTVGVNDAVACVLMRSNGISEIYSFDSDFDRIHDIKRVVV
jgi:hypothetical protein